MSEARLRSPSPWPQEAVMPNRDITAQAPGESERVSSELGCDEHHADRIMPESLAAAGREFFHALRAHIGCDGKKAGPTPCSAIWVRSLNAFAANRTRLGVSFGRQAKRCPEDGRGRKEVNQTAGANRTALSQKAPNQKHQARWQSQLVTRSHSWTPPTAPRYRHEELPAYLLSRMGIPKSPGSSP